MLCHVCVYYMYRYSKCGGPLYYWLGTMVSNTKLGASSLHFSGGSGSFMGYILVCFGMFITMTSSPDTRIANIGILAWITIFLCIYRIILCRYVCVSIYINHT